MSDLINGKTIGEVCESLESKTPEFILSWAWNNFSPKIAATSSFQTQSVPFLHMISKTIPKLKIFFLDTGFHFSETIKFKEELTNRFNLNVENLEPQMGHAGFLQEYPGLYKNDPDLCCYINKVEPLQRAKRNLNAWISGIRRDQSVTRKNTPIFSKQKDGTYKICPLANWAKADIENYLFKYDLPKHPLTNKGYISIGCDPCTRPVKGDYNDRSGRWVGFDKTECGIHFDYDDLKND